MKNFIEAYNYIRDTSAENIAKRTAIFGAYFNMYLKKNFGHDIILDIVAALYGPFEYKVKEDKKIMEMLDIINYGFNPQWLDIIIPWVNQYATSAIEAEAFVTMVKLLFNEKADKILVHFNYICQVIQPSEYDYFPEMLDMAGLHGSLVTNKWERI